MAMAQGRDQPPLSSSEPPRPCPRPGYLLGPVPPPSGDADNNSNLFYFDSSDVRFNLLYHDLNDHCGFCFSPLSHALDLPSSAPLPPAVTPTPTPTSSQCYGDHAKSERSDNDDDSTHVRRCPDCLVVAYCNAQCQRRDRQRHVGKQCNEFVKLFTRSSLKADAFASLPSCSLLPSCPSPSGRSNCKACRAAKNKSVETLPCSVRSVSGSNTLPEVKALEKLLNCFLTFLYKHQNDSLRKSINKLHSLFNQKLDDGSCGPVVKILHLYLVMMDHLTHLGGGDKLTLCSETLCGKLVGFYSAMTRHHKELSQLTRLRPRGTVWWNAYLLHWGKFAQWLLAVVFMRWAMVDNCQCSMKDVMQFPPVLELLELGPKLSDPAFRPGKDLCSVCSHILADASKDKVVTRHSWVLEYIEDEVTYPCQRIWPRQYDQLDLMLDIAYDGLMPVGWICSAACYAKVILVRAGCLKRMLTCQLPRCLAVVLPPPEVHFLTDSVQPLALCNDVCSYQFKEELEQGRVAEPIGYPGSKQIDEACTVGKNDSWPSEACKRCDWCKNEGQMMEQCQHCFVETYCSDRCRRRASAEHNCSSLQLRSLDKSVVLPRPREGPLRLFQHAAFRPRSHQDLFECRACKFCPLIFFQMSLLDDWSDFNFRPDVELMTMALNKHNVVSLSVLTTLCHAFSRFTVKLAVDYRSDQDPRISNLERFVPALEFIFDCTFPNASRNYSRFDCSDLDDGQTRLKFMLLYFLCLLMDAAFVECKWSNDLERQTADEFKKFYWPLLNALSQPLPLLAYLDPADGVEDEDNPNRTTYMFVSLQLKVLESFSRLFSFADRNQPSNEYIDYRFFKSVLIGFEPYRNVKTLEHRLIIACKLLDWFGSVQCFSFLKDCMMALVRYHEKRPHHLYFLPTSPSDVDKAIEIARASPARNGELNLPPPCSLLQNYVRILYKMITDVRFGFDVVREENLMEPVWYLEKIKKPIYDGRPVSSIVNQLLGTYSQQMSERGEC